MDDTYFAVKIPDGHIVPRLWDDIEESERYTLPLYVPGSRVVKVRLVEMTS